MLKWGSGGNVIDFIVGGFIGGIIFGDFDGGFFAGWKYESFGECVGELPVLALEEVFETERPAVAGVPVPRTDDTPGVLVKHETQRWKPEAAVIELLQHNLGHLPPDGINDLAPRLDDPAPHQHQPRRHVVLRSTVLDPLIRTHLDQRRPAVHAYQLVDLLDRVLSFQERPFCVHSSSALSFDHRHP